MPVTGKVALVSLIRSSDHGSLSSDEITEQLRQEIKSSSVAATWTIENVTVLDEAVSTPKELTTPKSKLAVM